ncbi:hypothetical protein B0H14DRAFT_2617281 [Mycena olivaceomarginata]|nr:hypothetical protein B0H14DRAFT_2617281 [Mycena olivaceomarginata]
MFSKLRNVILVAAAIVTPVFGTPTCDTTGPTFSCQSVINTFCAEAAASPPVCLPPSLHGVRNHTQCFPVASRFWWGAAKVAATPCPPAPVLEDIHAFPPLTHDTGTFTAKNTALSPLVPVPSHCLSPGWVKPDFPGFHLHHETQHRAVLNRREFPGRSVRIGPHHVMFYYFWEFKRISRSAWEVAIHRNTKVQLEVRQALNINNTITMKWKASSNLKGSLNLYAEHCNPKQFAAVGHCNVSCFLPTSSFRTTKQRPSTTVIRQPSCRMWRRSYLRFPLALLRLGLGVRTVILDLDEGSEIQSPPLQARMSPSKDRNTYAVQTHRSCRRACGPGDCLHPRARRGAAVLYPAELPVPLSPCSSYPSPHRKKDAANRSSASPTLPRTPPSESVEGTAHGCVKFRTVHRCNRYIYLLFLESSTQIPQIPERRKEREGQRHGVVCRDEEARRVRRRVVLEGDRNSRFVKQVLGKKRIQVKQGILSRTSSGSASRYAGDTPSLQIRIGFSPTLFAVRKMIIQRDRMGGGAEKGLRGG